MANLALGTLGGVLVATSFLSFSLWPLAWLAFVPILVGVARARSRREALAVGFAAGVATNVPAFHWLVGTIHSFGGFPLWLSAIFYGVLSAYSAVQFVVFAWAVRRSGFGPLGIVPALVWVALELSWVNLFPWRLANSQLEVIPLLQIGELTGPFGLSFAMVWFAAAAARAVVSGFGEARAALFASAALVIAIVGFGLWRLPGVDREMNAARPIRLGLVQGNLRIEEKGNVRFFQTHLGTYRRLTREIASAADVVIWPETVISEPLPRTLAMLSANAREILGLERPLLTGALTFTGSPEAPRFYNSVMLLDGEGRVLGLSDKQILMPFGEYLPFATFFPSLRELSPMTGDFEAGTEVKPLDVPGVGRFAPLNCYEDLLAPIARGAIRSLEAEIFFAVANDAWFGDTAAPYQHEALALWRAVENRRFLVRVTNTGVTDVIDAAGRVKLRLPTFAEAATVTEVRPLGGLTFYTRFGDVFGWVATALAALAVGLGRRITT